MKRILAVVMIVSFIQMIYADVFADKEAQTIPCENATIAPIDLSEAKVDKDFVHNSFIADFPYEVREKEKDGLTILKCQEGSYELQIVVCPFEIEPTSFSVFAKQMDVKIDPSTESDTTFSDFKSKRYECVSKYEEGIGQFYAVTNGESTIFFSSLSADGYDWWGNNHIRFLPPADATLPIEEKLNRFVEFFNNTLEDIKIESSIEDKCLTLTVTDSNIYRQPSREKMARGLFRLTRLFSVFRKLADEAYDFSIQLHDKDGKFIYGYDFPYSEYSTWKEEPKLAPTDYDASGNEIPIHGIGG